MNHQKPQGMTTEENRKTENIGRVMTGYNQHTSPHQNAPALDGTIARDEKEAGELIDNSWTYILTTPQNIMMFRKRK